MARVTFGLCPKDIDKDQFENLAHGYLADLCKNWQILGKYELAWFDGRLMGYASLSRRDAFETEHMSNWAKRSLAEIVGAIDHTPTWEMLDDGSEEELASWKATQSLVLFTHAYSYASPVRCGGTGIPVAVYRIPISQSDREDLLFWAQEYRACDSLWLSSRDLEIPAYKQLVEPSSGLSKRGHELCKKIEASTQVPAYYYLNRYWGRSANYEASRPCPGCAGSWLSPDPTPQEEKSWWNFQFKCDHCRLVGSMATSLNDDQHLARHGEYTERIAEQR